MITQKVIAMRAQLIDILTCENPALRVDYATIYADALIDYLSATENIREHGSVVLHPRTGAPVDNPYLKVRAASISQMSACKGVRVVIQAWEYATERFAGDLLNKGGEL